MTSESLDAWEAPRYERLVWRGGLALLGLLFAGGLSLALTVPMKAPDTAWLFPLVLLVPVGIWALPRRSGTPLVLLLALFGLVSGHSEDLKPEEVLFALALVSYLAWWFLTRAVILRHRIVTGVQDACILAFLFYVVASLGLSLVNGAPLKGAISELLVFFFLALYFPLREAFSRSSNGHAWAIGVVVYLGVVASLHVLTKTYGALENAEYAWEVARGRVMVNETFLYMASLLSLCLAATVRGVWRTAALGGAFAVFTVGLIMTQWRSYYVAWALAVGVIWLLGDRSVRLRSTLLLGIGVVGGGGLAVLLFGDTVALAALGIADRVLSIGSASSQDISLLNRQLETIAILDRIWESPIIGHGLSVDFSFYDAIFEGTWTKPYAHNTYLMLWFKFGLFGLGLFLTAWGAAIVSAFRALRGPTPIGRALALFVVAALGALTVSSTVSAALSTDDVVLTFTVLLAIGGALRETQVRDAEAADGER